MSHRTALPMILATLVALSGMAGCSDADSPGGDPVAAPPPPTLLGIYTGTFPCANCAGIDTLLWLRPDQRFVMRQRYVDESGASDDADAVSFGHWSWDGIDLDVVLTGTGPQRRFSAAEIERLTLRTDSPLPHVLDRDSRVEPPGGTMLLVGLTVIDGDSARLTECASGLALPIAGSAALGELRRQVRSLSGRGAPALTSLRGRLSHTETAAGEREVWIVEQVLTVKPNQGC